MNERALSRIPFRVRDELMIISMARWMRFIGVIKVVGGLLTGFFLLVGVIYLGAGLSTDLPALGKLGRTVAENRLTFFALALFALLLTVAGTLLGFVLYTAADDFERVARSDEADQDYITAGVRQLNTYFKLSILLGVAAVLVGLTAAIGLASQAQVQVQVGL
ncbi:MAG TPA: hypothetical protein VFF52_09945 [Isosphaeraceae bacterium]|nr:hypothetical protein [Isosphaeraceae bacterium]